MRPNKDKDQKVDVIRDLVVEMRELVGWTQHQTTAYAGVATNTLGNWERGKSRPTRANQTLLCTTLLKEIREHYGEHAAREFRDRLAQAGITGIAVFPR